MTLASNPALTLAHSQKNRQQAKHQRPEVSQIHTSLEVLTVWYGKGGINQMYKK